MRSSLLFSHSSGPAFLPSRPPNQKVSRALRMKGQKLTLLVSPGRIPLANQWQLQPLAVEERVAFGTRPNHDIAIGGEHFLAHVSIRDTRRSEISPTRRLARSGLPFTSPILRRMSSRRSEGSVDGLAVAVKTVPSTDGVESTRNSICATVTSSGSWFALSDTCALKSGCRAQKSFTVWAISTSVRG